MGRKAGTYGTIFPATLAILEPGSSAYEKHGVNRKNGCLAILRPDQHVSSVEHLEQREPVESFIAKSIISPSQRYRFNHEVPYSSTGT